ncbi:YkgJ family cysteine cluster protein [Bacillaceae bacterium W0354]
MTFLKLNEVKERLNHLSSFELNEDDFYEITDKYLEKAMPTKKRMIEIYKKLLLETSNKMTDMDEHMGMSPSCQLGCAFCCYFPIIITRLEAKMIIASIEEMSDDRREELINHLRNYFSNYESLIEEATSVDPESEHVKSHYIKKQLPCPLLNTETNSCMAYEIRPLPCRTYVNYTNPKVCADNLMPEEAVSFEFLYEGYMGALNEAAQVIFEEEAPDFLDYPMDVYETNYLPLFLKEWLENGITE